MSGRKLVSCLLALLVLVPFLAAPASLAQASVAQEDRRTAAFGIEVRQGRKAMPGVEVRLESEGPVRGTSPQPQVTDAEGRAEFWWLTPGIWRVDLVVDGEVAYFLTVRIDPGRRAEEMGSPARDVDAPDLRWKFFRPEGEPPAPPPPPSPDEPPSEASTAEPEAPVAEPEAVQPEPEEAATPEPTPEPAPPEAAAPEPEMEEPEVAESPAPEPAEETATEEVTPPPMIPDPTPPPTEDPTDEEPELAVEAEVEPEARGAEEVTPPPMIPDPTPPPTEDPSDEEPELAPEPEIDAPEPEADASEAPRTPEPAVSESTAPEPAVPDNAVPETVVPEPQQPPVPQPDPMPAPAVEDAMEDLPMPADRESEPVAEAPVEPAPVAGPRFTSGSGAGGDCPECKPSESAVTLERTVPPGDPGGGATCGPDMARAALSAARRLASRGQGLGPGMPLDGGELSGYTSTDASCQVLGVVLPPGVRYRGYTYSVEAGGDAGGPCYLPRACPVAGAIWTARPVIEELEGGARMVYGVFRNASAVPLRAELQVFYVGD